MQATPMPPSIPKEGFIRQKQLINSGIIPFSPTTLWRKVRDGHFPKPIKVSEQITAWRLSDIAQWAQDPAGYAIKRQGEK